jgi:type I restriction enzyme, S subunit
VQLGKRLSPKAKRGTSPMPYLANKNVQWGRIDLKEIQEMDFSQEEFQKFQLQPGDLVVCEGGEVGRCAIWQGQIEKCCFQKALHRLRPLDSTISTDYMLEFMIWGNAHGVFSSLTGHSTIAHLTAVKLKSLAVPVVSKSEQHAFLAKISSSRGAQNAALEQIQKTHTLRMLLIQQLGEMP